MSDQPVPLEKRADKVKRDLVRDYDADGVERKPRRTISELEQQLAAAEVALSEVQQERERIGQHLLTSIEQRDESTRRFIESDESAYQLQQQVTQQAETISQLRDASDKQEHVAWLCYRNNQRGEAVVRVCGSDDQGAFKVYR